jgi:hypothetical protein
MSLLVEIAVIENGEIRISSKIRQQYLIGDPKSVLELGIYITDLSDIYLGNFDRGSCVWVQEHTWRHRNKYSELDLSIDRACAYLRRCGLRLGAVNKTVRNE